MKQQQQQQRFRLDRKKFPTVCARRYSSRRCDPQGTRGIFPSWRWFGKKGRQPGPCGPHYSLDQRQAVGPGPRQPLMSAVSVSAASSLPVTPSYLCLLGGPDSLWEPVFCGLTGSARSCSPLLG